MLWPEHCWGARYIIDDRYGGYVLERCDDFSGAFYGVLLMTNSPWWALDMIEFFSSDEWFAVRKLIDVLIADAVMLKGTHGEKNRFIARLRKFISLLKDIHVSCGFYSVPLSRLLGLSKLSDYVRVLNAFKGRVHRVRNRVHELLYPHLIEELKMIKNVNLWFSSERDSWYYRDVAIDFDFEHHSIRLRIGNKSKLITMGEARTILKKITEREERRMHEERLERATYLQLELLEPIPKVII